jgi:protein lifeguard
MQQTEEDLGPSFNQDRMPRQKMEIVDSAEGI